MIDLDNNLDKIIAAGRTKEEYLQDYNDIISNAKNRGIDRSKLNGYYEIHHDIPRSVRPDLIKEKSNLTALTAKEHIVCHILLYRIYPEDDRMAFAADCMLGCHMLCKDTIEREEVIQSIDVSLISELREKVLSKLSKKVIAFTLDKNGNPKVCIELASLNEARSKGYSNIHGSIKNHTYCGKYRWEYSSIFIDQFPKEYSDYLNKIDSGWIPSIEEKPKTVSESYKDKKKLNNGVIVCINERTDEIERIYKNQSEATKDGFHLSAVNRSLTSGKPTVGYYFKFLSDVEKEDIERFNENDKPKLRLKTDEIVCYDLFSYKIYKIYKNLRETAVDGFTNTTICNVLKSDTKEFRGYRWEYLYNWENEEELEKYYNSEEKAVVKGSRLPSDPQKVVKCSLDLEVVEIYENLHSIPGYDYRLISVIINRDNNIYTKEPTFRWFKYERFKQQYPEKLKEYESRNTDIDNP